LQDMVSFNDLPPLRPKFVEIRWKTYLLCDLATH
jgi:hypothetical protein